MKTYNQAEVDEIIYKVKNIKNAFLEGIDSNLKSIQNIKETFVTGVEKQLEKLQNLQPANDESVCKSFMPGDPADPHNPSRCRGTKEMDVCSCEGDKSKCDFYSTNREKAKKLEWRQKPQYSEEYVFIASDGSLEHSRWDNCELDNCRFNVGNCFPRKLFTEEQVQQIAWQNQLNSLLAQYATTNNALASKEEKADGDTLYWIYDNKSAKSDFCCYPNTPVFNNREIAEQSIKDVIDPFYKKHPDFIR